jgi:hypothetical protein
VRPTVVAIAVLLIAIVLLAIAVGSRRTESVVGWLATAGLWGVLIVAHAFEGPWDFKLIFLVLAAVVFTAAKIAEVVQWFRSGRGPASPGPPRE